MYTKKKKKATEIKKLQKKLEPMNEGVNETSSLIPLLLSSWRWLWASLLSCWGWQQSRLDPPESRTTQRVYSNLSTLFLNHLDTETEADRDNDCDIQSKTVQVSVFNHWLWVCTCHKVSESYGGQGDDHKVKGLQRGPTLDVFKDGCRECDKQQAAKQHKQQGGDDTNLCLTDVPVLQERGRQRQGKWRMW